jgi:methionine-rich copper-binding protein CopC
MKKVLLVLLSMVLFSGNSAYAAHAKLAKSTPEDGSVSAAPPPAFVLEFTEAVTVHQAFLKRDNGKETPLRNLPHNDAKTITIPVTPLAAGHYVLDWSVFTHDSLVLSGRLQFTVSGETAPSAR